jgi:hypothetical protein
MLGDVSNYCNRILVLHGILLELNINQSTFNSTKGSQFKVEIPNQYGNNSFFIFIHSSV